MINLPPYLQYQIEKGLNDLPLKTLAKARAALSQAYQDDISNQSPIIHDAATQQAYVLSRLPTIFRVLYHLLSPWKALEIQSVLDIGAGPGTASWVALDCWPEITSLVHIERDQALISWARQTAQSGGVKGLKQQHWDLNRGLPDNKADLIVASYCLNEISSTARTPIIETAWQQTQKMCLLVEPGTPRGFQVLREARAQLLAAGAYIWGPCPHAAPCPMLADDWCHFSLRVPRSKTQRYLKQADKGYEDEKYAYLLLGKTPSPVSSSGGRILRHPQIRKGHLEVRLCAPEGEVINQVYTKKHKALYKEARKARWGDNLEIPHA